MYKQTKRGGEDVRMPFIVLKAIPDKILLHLLLVVAIALFTYWEMSDIYHKGSLWFPVMKTSAIYLSVVYLNIYLLAPRLLLKRRWYGVYLLVVLYVVLIVYFIEIRLDDVFYLQYTPKIRLLFGKIEINPLLQVFTSVISYVLLMISSSAIILFREWARQDTRVRDLEKTTMLMELEQLKKQVSPQFLIRMLDHANELSAQGYVNEATALLLKLGAILRYQLYDSARKNVLLSSDIRFLTEILALEKQFRPGFGFTVESEGNIQNYLIPPLLFLPVVEHHISENRRFIGLYFRVGEDGLLFEGQSKLDRFFLRNDVSACRHCEERSNLGKAPQACELTDLDRRLKLLYDSGYSLETKIENDRHVTRLRISAYANDKV